MSRLVLSVLIFAVLLLGVGGSSNSAAERSFVLYGNGSLDLGLDGGIQAIDLASGHRIGQVAVGGLTQGGGFALATNGRRAYLLDRAQGAGVAEWHLSELAAPSLQALRRSVVPDAISLLGWGRVVAIAADGQQVY